VIGYAERMRWFAGLTLLMIVLAAPLGHADKVERVVLEVELKIDQLVLLTQYRGKATVVDVDPRYVLAGRVVWSGNTTVMALGSDHAFAIHSPTRLGLSGARRGDTICLQATRTTSDGKTSWKLGAMVPDAGCGGGG
jgi:hypothetical protein